MAMLKPQINGKSPKNAKNNLLKTKRILKPKDKLVGPWILHLSGQWSQIDPHPSRQLLHYNKHIY